ncbi:hypothetical protein EV356DRAFT_511953 [Viridothelium virens]|uniref:Zn(2)-C6 fungal-type domain-containing protein n=1 Tax=Viridothelium virens TaxID=1048519 RepID=A0A6A6HGJ3_VIRVR|nr:hypothetical protein EV356DRAFT_511953 [Viridothelium virens]
MTASPTDAFHGVQNSSPQSTASSLPISALPAHQVSTPATNTTSSSGSGSSSLNPRSCVTCRRRKVKCDKKHPCSNCVRAHIDCIYPAPGRAPRKVKKSTDGDLMDRLRRLEGIMKSLEPEIEEHHSVNGNSRQGSKSDVPVLNHRDSIHSLNGEKAWSPVAPPDDSPDATADSNLPDNDKDPVNREFENRFGRLVIHEGKSRYVNNSFWASLSGEVEDIKGILNEDTEDETDSMSPTSQSQVQSDLQGFMFGYSSSNINMFPLHPPFHTVKVYIQLFKENVDPVVKLLHMPTAEPLLLAHAEKLDKLPKGLEVLFFAIYYCVITSLSPEQCMETFGEERSVLLGRYQFGVQQALARANFLITEEMVVLQGFVLFLLCLRRNDDARTIWTLTGLIVRIAQTLGLHRDGSHFNLSPFETEIRRRLWWQICILDSRASEDHGCDPSVIDQLFDTEMPLNVNDNEISPDMTEFPELRAGFTEMTFSLIRCEVTSTFRRLNYVPPNPKMCFEKFSSATFEDKKRWVTECHQRLEERYLKYCDMSVPLYWVTATTCRLIMAKMWLMIYHPFQRKDGGRSLPPDVKDKLFLTSLENIEYMLLLETEAQTMKWGWLIKTYVQWHALAFLLTELCVRTKGPMVDRAWAAVERTMKGQVLVQGDEKRGHLWKPLRKLWAKAKSVRTRELEQEHIALQRAKATLFDDNNVANIQASLVDQSVRLDPQIFTSDPGNGANWDRERTSVSASTNSLGQRCLDELNDRQRRISREQTDLHETSMSFDPARFDIEPSSAVNGTRRRQTQQRSTSGSAFAPSQVAASQQPEIFDAPLGLASPSTLTSNIKADMDTLDNINTTGSFTSPSSNIRPSDVSSAPSDFPVAGRSNGMSSPEGIPFDITTGQDAWIDGDAQLTWANFDDMVRQFGMDVDQPGQGITTNYAPGQGGFAGMNGTMPGMENWW